MGFRPPAALRAIHFTQLLSYDGRNRLMARIAVSASDALVAPIPFSQGTLIQKNLLLRRVGGQNKLFLFWPERRQNKARP